MNQNAKKLEVAFVQYEPYEPCPMWYYGIGFISMAQANEFLRILADTPRYVECCPCHCMDAQYESHVGVSRGDSVYTPRTNKNADYIQPGKLMLSNVFFDDSKLQCKKHKNRNQSEITKMHACAAAMRSGKCVDPLMRKLAAMMYPEKYNGKGQR